MDQSPMSNLEQGYRIAYLIAQHLKGVITEAERIELDQWLSQSANNRRLFDQLTDPQYLEAQAREQNDIDTDSYLGKFKANMIAKDRKTQRIWIATAVAAAVFSVLMITVIRPFKNEVTQEDVLASIELKQPAPAWKGWRKATLSIADKNFSLGESARDTIIEDGIAIKGGTTLVYAPENAESGHHIIRIPAKGTYTVQLPDGTVITLNSLAQLSYDIPFDESERRVELKGEGYFQVAKDAERPFRVVAKSGETTPVTIEAIGTAFNVLAAESGAPLSATLVEGKVKVSTGKDTALILRPDEMAYLGKNGLKKKTVDASAAIAWTQHKFIFQHTPLVDVLGQLTLWYGTRFITDHIPDEQMNGTFSRDEPVEDILRKLARTGAFRYKTEGQRITIY
jgi:transmembrane sensor